MLLATGLIAHSLLSLAAGLTMLISAPAHGQLSGIEAHQAVIDWAGRRSSVLVQSSYVAFRLRTAMSVVSTLPQGMPPSSDDLAAIDAAIDSLQAAREHLDSAYAGLPPPPALAEADIARRLNDSLPVLERARTASLATYDAAISWLQDIRLGRDRDDVEFRRLLIDSQIDYLDALIDLQEVSQGSDLTNPGTLEAAQTAAVNWVMRNALGLVRAELRGASTDDIWADAEPGFEAAADSIQNLSEHVQVQAAAQLLMWDRYLESNPSLPLEYRAARDTLAEIADTYDVIVHNGWRTAEAVRTFVQDYGGAETAEERQHVVESLFRSLDTIVIRNNEARSRRNRLARVLARMFDDL